MASAAPVVGSVNAECYLILTRWELTSTCCHLHCQQHFAVLENQGRRESILCRWTICLELCLRMTDCTAAIKHHLNLYSCMYFGCVLLWFSSAGWANSIICLSACACTMYISVLITAAFILSYLDISARRISQDIRTDIFPSVNLPPDHANSASQLLIRQPDVVRTALKVICKGFLGY